MPIENQRWDPNSPRFIDDALRVMLGLWGIVFVIGTYLYRRGWLGFLIGGAFAIVLYLIAVRAGKVLAQTSSYASTMRWVLVSQFILWVIMALLLAGLKVNPIGFVIGASILLLAILLTLAWYTLRKRRLSS